MSDVRAGSGCAWLHTVVLTVLGRLHLSVDSTSDSSISHHAKLIGIEGLCDC